MYLSVYLQYNIFQVILIVIVIADNHNALTVVCLWAPVVAVSIFFLNVSRHFQFSRFTDFLFEVHESFIFLLLFSQIHFVMLSYFLCRYIC